MSESAVTKTMAAVPVLGAVTAARALYVHVPFCLHHCGYCDFSVIAGHDQLIPDYLTALRNEFQYLAAATGIASGICSAEARTVDTIFIGGGTPTQLPAAQLSELLELIAQYFRIAPDGEYSVEVNPDGLSNDRLQVLEQGGVNRLSLGVQSFEPACLTTLERRHTAAEAIGVILNCRQIIPNLSADLIFAVPGQDLTVWRQTLQQAVSLPLQHISTYGLTFEPGTPFHRRRQQGRLQQLDDELERAMYLEAVQQLTDAGFVHYEVSNFARPGFQCRHNQTYWRAESYFAAGPGAASYVNGVRCTNCRSVIRWLKSWLSHERRAAGTEQLPGPCVEQSESLTVEEQAREAIMLALRMVDGLDCASFERRFGLSLQALAGEAIRKHVRSGLLTFSSGRLKLTTEGLLLADSVVVDFL